MPMRWSSTELMMFLHYLIIALRNIRKYALQNTVSILGLAAGFICLSLSALWIHFEESFDTFHKDADRIFTFSNYEHEDGTERHDGYVNYTEHEQLYSFPEIEKISKYVCREHKEENLTELRIDTAFLKIFDLPIVSGNDGFTRDTGFIAISSTYARKTFRYVDPIGMEILGKTISAVVKDFGRMSAIQFDLLSCYNFKMPLKNTRGNYIHEGMSDDDLFPSVFIKIHKGIDTKAFADKIHDSLNDDDSYHYELLPIGAIHRQTAKTDMYVNYAHAKVFCLLSLMLMLCAIINFLLFSLNGIRTRSREMALRTVSGATGHSLVCMLVTELGVILAIAMIAGLIIVQFIKSRFISLADIQMTGEYVTMGSIVIMILVLIVSLLISIAAVRILRRRTMHSSITSALNIRSKKASIGIQVFTSILFLYIVVVMARQFSFIRHNDWGSRINDIAVLSISNPVNRWDGYMMGRPVYYPPKDDDEIDVPTRDEHLKEFGYEYLERLDGQFGLTDKLKSLPSVKSLYRNFGDIEKIQYDSELLRWDRATVNGRDSLDIRILDILEPDKLELLNFNIIDGTLPDRPLQKDEIIITQNIKKELGLADVCDEPTITIGRHYIMPITDYYIDANGELHINNADEGTMYYTFRVIAVVSDIYPNKFDTKPIMFIMCTPANRRLMPPASSSGWTVAHVTLTYEHGMKSALRNDVTRIMDETGLKYELTFPEDRFFESLASQEHLKNLVMGLGIICILIAIFGTYSMIVLACRERKREIAVRKVHGAKVIDIIRIFGREYGGTLLASTILAFGIGYIMMHRWIQQYERQVAISWWIYAAILAAIVIVISLTVGHQVLKTARENPADVIKSE